MKDYGTVRSTVKPNPLAVDEISVWEHKNITAVEEVLGDEVFDGYEYAMVQYSKDEYILKLAEESAITQHALLEVILNG